MDTTEDGADHWGWRPEWSDERACAFWYLTVPPDEVRAPGLERYCDALDAVPWLDTVPPRWWHLTLTEVGYVEDLGAGLLAEVSSAVRSAVGQPGPLRVELGPVVSFRTAIALVAGPDAALREVQAVARERTQAVLGADRPVVHPTRFRPHVSLAYLNRHVPAAEVGARLAEAPAGPSSVVVDRITLAEVTRRDRHYQWRVLDEVELAAP
ncbi:2'-5' RNA ligase family protein [Nocardioides sp. W7]|uniref:2'-5' RNA ligase family protein n=1 Tax=Nocardioides sp. W7 TaxID=2931390 RepID=UPI001FCFA1ED|nr:2'-5' RNA ligase family protein [Nocardioides sp. W7]